MSISTKIKGQLQNGSWIRKLFEEGDRLRQIHGADKVYDFSIGNPGIEPPEQFKANLLELAQQPIPGMHRYMSNAGYEFTRAAVAEALNDEHGLSLTAEHVVMTVGAGGGLNVVLKTLLDKDEEVILIKPFFVEYVFYVDNHGGQTKIVSATPDFQLDLEAIKAAITPKTKAIIVNTPNNPTGVIYSEDSLVALDRLLKEYEAQHNQTIYVISDEPYSKIIYDNAKFPAPIKYITNCIMVTSHSKDLALPGERIGYIAVNPNIKEVDLLCAGLVFSNRVLGFVNAPALMQRLVANLQKVSVNIAEYEAKRNLLFETLTSYGFDIVKPQGAFYLFVKSPLEDDVAFVNAALKYNIILVPGVGFGYPGYFRISYCVDMATIKNSFAAFKELATEFGLTK